jgi:hypothetical protein
MIINISWEARSAVVLMGDGYQFEVIETMLHYMEKTESLAKSLSLAMHW